MAVLSAKAFSKATGFPLAMIRKLCRSGTLPHWKCGRVYLLDVDKAMTAMNMQQEALPVPVPVSIAKQNCRIIKNDTQGPQRLRELIKQKKSARSGNCKAQAPS